MVLKVVVLKADLRSLIACFPSAALEHDLFFFFFFFITEHTQVTPGLPMLQSFILTYIQVSNYFHCFSFHHRIHIWYVLYNGDIDFSKSDRFSMRWVSPGKVSHNCDPI